MINQLDFRDFECFITLANTLHYRKAADQLHITQSALSQKVQRLEKFLGHSLFDRTNRKVALSVAGVAFREEVQLIMNQTRLSLERWKLRQEGHEGLIRIGFVGSAMQGYLAPVIRRFSERHPGIQFRLECLNNQDQVQGVDQLTLDVGFIRSSLVPDHMDLRSVHREHFTLVLPLSHPISRENFRHMGQLAPESFILFPNETSNRYFQLIVAMCEDQGFTPKITHRAIDGPTIFKLVESNLGVSVVPVSLKDEHNYRVKFIDLDMVAQQTELFAVWNRNNPNPAIGCFLEQCEVRKATF